MHKALNTSYSDVGECSSYIKTMKEIASEDTFKNIPQSIKKEVAKNIYNEVIFNTDVKDEYNKLLGNGYSKGNIMVLPNE